MKFLNGLVVGVLLLYLGGAFAQESKFNWLDFFHQPTPSIPNNKNNAIRGPKDPLFEELQYASDIFLGDDYGDEESVA